MSVLAELKKLEEATTEEEKRKRSYYLLRHGGEEKRFVERYLALAVEQLLKRHHAGPEEAAPLVKVLVTATPWGEATRLSLAIAVLQDYRLHRDDLPQELLSLVTTYVRDHNLTYLLSDITLNELRWSSK